MMTNEEERRYRDQYFEAKFEALHDILDKSDLNQTRLFEKCNSISIDLAALKEAKKERDRRAIVSGGFSGAIVGGIIFIISFMTGSK